MSPRHFISISATILLASVHPSRAAALKPTGIICIDPIPKGSVWKANETGATEKSVFSVKIDDQVAVKITVNAAAIFTNLPTATKHLVKIRLDGKPLTSFRVSFAEYESDHLRLWYNTMYGTWSLSPTSAKHRCASRRE